MFLYRERFQNKIWSKPVNASVGLHIILIIFLDPMIKTLRFGVIFFNATWAIHAQFLKLQHKTKGLCVVHMNMIPLSLIAVYNLGLYCFPI